MPDKVFNVLFAILFMVNDNRPVYLELFSWSITLDWRKLNSKYFMDIMNFESWNDPDNNDQRLKHMRRFSVSCTHINTNKKHIRPQVDDVMMLCWQSTYPLINKLFMGSEGLHAVPATTTSTTTTTTTTTTQHWVLVSGACDDKSVDAHSVAELRSLCIYYTVHTIKPLTHISYIAYVLCATLHCVCVPGDWTSRWFEHLTARWTVFNYH